MREPRDTTERTLQLVEGIARLLGLLPLLPEDPPPMPTVTQSIGTSGRDWSTITAWESQLDSGTYYSAGDDAVGECYADSDFTGESGLTINGGGTIGLNSVKLTAAAGEGHDGTAGTGVVIKGAKVTIAPPNGFNQAYEISWIEIDGEGTLADSAIWSNGDAGDVPILHHLICHGCDGNQSFRGVVRAEGRDITLHNSIVYDNVRSGTTCYGIRVDGDRPEGCVVNCVVDKIDAGVGTAKQLAVSTNSSNATIKNNISLGGSGSTGVEHFSFAGTNPDSSHNISGDATADDAGGTGHQTSVAIADIKFVSRVDGSEDYHILAGSVAEDAGVDVSSIGSDIEFDINGDDRTGATWDIGVHELEASGGGPVAAVSALAQRTIHKINHLLLR